MIGEPGHGHDEARVLARLRRFCDRLDEKAKEANRHLASTQRLPHDETTRSHFETLYSTQGVIYREIALALREALQAAPETPHG